MSNLFKGNIAIGGHITPTSPQDTFFVTTEEFHRGDRIAQMVIAKHEHAEFEPADELSSTERGEGGFGHTGK